MNMLVIGICGGSGSGKTTLLKEIAKRGGFCLDCDALYYQMLKTNAPLRSDLTRAFGNVFLPDGSLNRRALGQLVYQDEKALDTLNGIVYKHMGMELDGILRHEAAVGTPILGIDAVNLFESGFADRCHATVAVTADPEIRLKRIMERDGIPEDYARRRIEAQQPDSLLRARADYTIENNYETEAEFRAAASALIEKILQAL